MAKKKTLAGDLIDITVAAAIAGPAIQITGTIPGPVGRGTQSLIGVALLKGAANLVDDDII